MSFQLVYLSQQDPKWKADILGFGDPGDTIGYIGCALTSVAMLLSGHGYPETPRTLNQKLKNVGGFVSAAIAWSAVNKIYPNVTLKAYIPCANSDAPLAQIDAALAAGQPAIVQVDSSPAPKIQTHWVVVYKREGDDYLMLDPWPYQPDTSKPDYLMKRYAQGMTLKRAISHVILYEAYGSGGPVTPPTQPTTDTTTPSGPSARVKAEVTWGLNLRSSVDTSGTANVVAVIPAGTQLLLLESDGLSRVGAVNQMLRVRTPQGQEGFVAAWYLEKVPAATPAPGTEPAPTSSGAETPGNEAPGTSSTINRTRPSIGDGLENVALEAPAAQRINDNSLLARIWNKYGGLLARIAEKMDFDPAIAVAILGQESGGQPYGPNGRLIIRFENHLFYDYWGKNNTSVYNNYFQTGSPRWTGHRWRPRTDAAWQDCHTGQGMEWDVFTFACTLDDTAAKKSISMGLPQVLGSNFGVLGFASVQDMFNAFVVSERNQVVAFFDFLQGNGPTATNALKTRDFRTIASIYNGAGQADYYGNLIKGHYNNFVALRGTQPPESPPSTPTEPSTPTAPGTPPAPAPQKFQVVVKANGTKVYGSATGSQVMITEKAGTRLTVVESVESATAKIGIKGKRINVKATNNKRGYVDAEKVKLS